LNIRVPDTIKLVSESAIKSFSPQDRLQYYDKVILEVLRANSDGLTAPEVESATGFYRRTVAQHLSRLVERGEATSMQRGKISMYYPNGDVVGKPFVIQSKIRDGRQYVVNKLKGKEGISYYIQLKELDAYRTLKVKGGITVDKEDLEHFIRSISTYGAQEYRNG
jgi:hypothetical protein